MMAAMEFVRSKGVEPSSLIHDGLLVPVSATSLIDCEALGEHVRNATGLQCSFAVKPMTLTDDDLQWKETVVKAYDEAQLARQQVKDQRSDDVKAVLEAAIEGGTSFLVPDFSQDVSGHFGLPRRHRRLVCFQAAEVVSPQEGRVIYYSAHPK